MPATREKGETKTKKRNNVTPDVILKDFWQDKERFADLFNAALFDGEPVLKPEKLADADADKSSIVKIGPYVDTVKRVFDVVKKTSDGIDFVIFGIENQQKIHYAMPLRHMLGDALSYLKESKLLEAKNKEEHVLKTSDEFLSGLRKTDRLHPVISLCIYYGEDDWDGPLSLKDMLQIPKGYESLVSNYEMHLLEVKKSGELKFHNKDVQMLFEISRMIYEKEVDKLDAVYEQKDLDTEILLAVGAVTKSQRMINRALEAQEKGEQMTPCKALQEWEQQCTEKGRREGLTLGEAKGIIRLGLDCGLSQKDIIEKVKEKMNLSEQEALDYYNQFATI